MRFTRQPLFWNSGEICAFHENEVFTGIWLMARTTRVPHLDIPKDKLGFIILKAREFDAKESDSDPDEGSNASDDGNIDVLTDKADDPVRDELLGAIRELSED